MKYAPLGTWLANQPATKAEISLRFAEIEKIIGAKLPVSASTYREWWANQEYGTHAPHWRHAGFLVDAVDLGRKIVRFRRGTAAKARKPPTSKRKPQELMPMAEQTLQNMEVLLFAGFNKIGDWKLADGKIRLTGQIPSEPGVYAHILDGKIYYIGSATMGLKKRLYFYTKPGITQHTSIRINKLIAKALASEKDVITIAASPEALTWNDLPVCCVTGLEAGLVRQLSPPWNKRGVTTRRNGSIAGE